MEELLLSPAFWGSLVTLTFLEVVLGIDNLLFVSIAVGNLQGKEQKTARRIGVWGAMALRIAMLGAIYWIIALDAAPLFTLPDGLSALFGADSEHARDAFREVTVKDLILLAGGLFLLWKGTGEIHAAVEGVDHEKAKAKSAFGAVLLQLLVELGFHLGCLGAGGIPGLAGRRGTGGLLVPEAERGQPGHHDHDDPHGGDGASHGALRRGLREGHGGTSRSGSAVFQGARERAGV